MDFFEMAASLDTLPHEIETPQSVSVPLKTGPVSGWTPERDARLRELWNNPEKPSSSKIRDIFLDEGFLTTRSAIMGKVRRMKLDWRGAGTNTKHIPKLKAVPGPRRAVRSFDVNFKPVEHVVREIALPFVCEPLNKSLNELGPNDCRWITNDDTADARYCGHSPCTRSFCSDHYRIVYEPYRGRLS